MMTTMTIQIVETRLSQLEKILSRFEIQKEQQIKSLENLSREMTRLGNEIFLNEASEKVISQISQRILGSSTSNLDKLITSGLRIVLPDQNLEFKTEITTYRKKTAIEFKLIQDGKVVPLLDSYGGGVLVLIGVLLRVMVIILLDMRRILLLDETLMHLASKYIPDASKLMKKLCDKLGFTILMITHQPDYATYADNHFEARPSVDGVKFVKM